MAAYVSDMAVLNESMCFDSFENAFTAVRQYEEETGSHFVIVKRRKSGMIEQLLLYKNAIIKAFLQRGLCDSLHLYGPSIRGMGMDAMRINDYSSELITENFV
jgi:hypothetical protein